MRVDIESVYRIAMRRIVDAIVVVGRVVGVRVRGGEEDICLCSPEDS